MPRTKTQSGQVDIIVQSDRLRLRWSWIKSLGGDGKRYVLPLGLTDTQVNRRVAETKAKLIEQDLATNHFDPLLKKYRSESASSNNSPLTVVAFFEKFIEAKTPHVYKTTLIKYRGLLSHLKQFFKQKPAAALSESDAIAFRDWLLNYEELAHVTVRDKLFLMAACWDWANREKLTLGNPWDALTASFKVPPKQKPKPFTRDEVKAIVQGFRTDSEYCYYGDFVEFFLSIGCRTGEAVALRWEHLSDDCSVIWIGQSVTVDGDRKATKTNEARSFPLPERLQKLLLARRPENYLPKAPVFPSPRKGTEISTRNFAKRAWTIVLGKLGIDYRRPYTSRHTSASIAIFEYGENPAVVARRLGHDPKTLYKSYLSDGGGHLSSPPDLLAD
jgi:integrase